MTNDFFEQSFSGFLITDNKGIILQCNPALAAWTDYSPDELKGKRFTDLLSIGTKIYYETHLGPLLKMQGFFAEVLIELSGKNNRKLKVLLSANQQDMAVENPGHSYFTMVQAGDRLQYEKNLQVAKNVAESALLTEKETVNLREQLIAVLGHDLRNPLNAIGMATTMLEDSVKDETGMMLLATIGRSNRRMTELIANIMDFARTRLGGGININRQSLLLEPVITQVVQELQLAYPNREIKVNIELSQPVIGDAYRIAQLLSNLVANALIHGFAESPVVIEALHKDDFTEIIVINQGEPIPETLQHDLFAPFTRETNRENKQGLGLGLYIAAEIARAHDGELYCISEGRETRFVFRIPEGR